MLDGTDDLIGSINPGAGFSDIPFADIDQPAYDHQGQYGKNQKPRNFTMDNNFGLGNQSHGLFLRVTL
jgi:hypothetical protein